MPASPRTPADSATPITADSGQPTLRDPAVGGVPALTPLRPGETLGRYLVIERLGTGGMGVVYAAYDRELDRKVALKLLHGIERDGSAASEGQRLLLREAQAIARLSHPAVVTVHEVGEHEGRVFMAMEFVDGVTLSVWLARERPPLERVLTAFAAAGRGLAAAHEAGIVHRDFKPDNVMVGRPREAHALEARVRVMDFGLARTDESTGAVRIEHDAEAVELSRSAGAIGTPAYMAPEQHLGLRIDARADQFSFCVALFEAVYGRRPFAGSNAVALAHAVTSGRIETPAGAGVPAWLRRVLLRGLASDPQRRFANMPALLSELERWPRRLRALRFTGVGLIALVAVGIAGMLAGGRTGPDCDGAPERLAGIADESTLAAVEATLTAIDRPYAAHAAVEVRRRLAIWYGGWIAEHRDACLATHERGEQSPERLDRRMACLDRQRRDTAALVEVLRDADGDVLDHAVAAVDRLARPASCDQAADRGGPPERVDDPVLATARDRVAQAKALQRAGRYPQAQDLAVELLEQARADDNAVLVAEVGRVVGELEIRLGHAELALPALEDAYYAALAIDYGDAAFDAAITLSYLDAAMRDRPEEATRWIRSASAELGEEGPHERTAELEHAHGIVLAVARRSDAAIEHFERAVSLFEREPDNELAIAHLHGSIGLEHYNMRRLDAALDHMRRALATEEDLLGPEHPDLAFTLNDIANAEEHSGRLEDAVSHHRRALAIRIAALGPMHRLVSGSYENLGLALSQLGRHDEAEQQLRHALRILEATMSAGDREIADATSNLGYVLGRAGRHADAIPWLERSVAIYEREPDRTPPAITYPLLGLARARLALGEPSAAWPLAERSRTACTSGPLHDTLCATATFVLARALWDADEDRTRARELADEARTVFAARATTHGEDLAETERWLADHPAPG